MTTRKPPLDMMLEDGRPAVGLPLELILAIMTKANDALVDFDWDEWEVEERLRGGAIMVGLACCIVDMGSANPERQRATVDQAIETLMSMRDEPLPWRR